MAESAEDTQSAKGTLEIKADNVPAVIVSFLQYFHKHFNEKNQYELTTIYETSFQHLSDRNYKNSEWPTVAELAPKISEGDELFFVLYGELTYRHIYSRLSPSVQQRIDSWQNYEKLFSLLLDRPDDDPLDVVIPTQWLWDIVDEYVYQLQDFYHFNSKNKSRSEEDAALLQNSSAWNVSRAIEWLNKFVVKSEVLTYLSEDGEAAPKSFGQERTYRMLGYFSIISLLRLHCLCGDFYMALRVLDPIDLSQKTGLFSSVLPCHTTLFYYAGFAYMMMRRYIDAQRTFSSILTFLLRNEQQSRSSLYDQIQKRTDQMCQLLAICISLSSQQVDDNLQNLLKEKCGERFTRMQRGEIAAFDEAYLKGCPKAISVGSADGDKAQLALFLNDVKQQLVLPTIRGYLKLYTTIPVSKLAGFLEVEDEVLRSHLYSLKNKSSTVVWESGCALDGVVVNTADVEFYIEGDMIHVNDTKVTKNYVDSYLHLIERFRGISNALENKRRNNSR